MTSTEQRYSGTSSSTSTSLGVNVNRGSLDQVSSDISTEYSYTIIECSRDQKLGACMQHAACTMTLLMTWRSRVLCCHCRYEYIQSCILPFFHTDRQRYLYHRSMYGRDRPLRQDKDSSIKKEKDRKRRRFWVRAQS